MSKHLKQFMLSFTNRKQAGQRALALRYRLEYLALRVWILLTGSFPIDANLSTARLIGRAWWRLIKRHRERAMEHLRKALGDQYSEAELTHIARESFQHFTQLYLVELAQTPRLVHEWSWANHVELGNMGPALRELLSDRGVIMLTGHFGSYELLGYTIARLGIPLYAVMRPLDNPLINEYLVASRQASGLNILYKKGAAESAQSILEDKGTLCFIADQNAGHKGLFVDFFGQPASTYKSIGLLAIHHRVPIVVGAARRTSPRFEYDILAPRVIRPDEWEHLDDPLRYITQEYTRAIELIVRDAPEQYLWIHRRWKSQPGQRRKRRSAAAGASG